MAHAPGRQVEFTRQVTTWHTVGNEDEAFYLRVYGTGDYRYKGADMGVVVARGRMQTDDRELTERAKRWATGITRCSRALRPTSCRRGPSPCTRSGSDAMRPHRSRRAVPAGGTVIA